MTSNQILKDLSKITDKDTAGIILRLLIPKLPTTIEELENIEKYYDKSLWTTIFLKVLDHPQILLRYLIDSYENNFIQLFKFFKKHLLGKQIILDEGEFDEDYAIETFDSRTFLISNIKIKNNTRRYRDEYRSENIGSRLAIKIDEDDQEFNTLYYDHIGNSFFFVSGDKNGYSAFLDFIWVIV
jgi:hypothetical protein